MRLIDADALADALFDQRRNYPQWVADTIGNMPEAVVRCKDCWKKGDPYLCIFDRDSEEYGGHRTEADNEWFCADGERREDDA